MKSSHKDSNPANIIKWYARTYGIIAFTAKLIQANENWVYLISTSNHRFILRLTPDTHRTRVQLESEIEWMLYLSRNGVHTPNVLRSLNSNLIEVLEIGDGKQVSGILFEYVDGKHFILSQVSYEYIAAQGSLLGQIHSLAKKYNPSYYRSWEEGSRIYIRSYLENCERDLLSNFDIIEQNLLNGVKNASNFGMCHGDLHTGNILVDRSGKFTLIDFDNSESFYFIYDIAVIFYDYAVSYKGPFELNKILEQFMRGYLLYNPVEVPLQNFRDTFIYRGFLVYAFFQNLKMRNMQLERNLSGLKLSLQNGFREIEIDLDFVWTTL